MKIYFAGESGFRKREIEWMLLINNRLLSFYEIEYDERDLHYHQRAFLLIKELKRGSV